jgi:F-type H+-transporting ATPase subunit gamma
LAGAKEIKRRIRSVTNTKQIISAMEMVSVVKMQKAVSRDLTSRKFTEAGTDLLTQVCYGVDPSTHPLLSPRTGTKKLVIVITSDRGLCGALNTRVIKEAVLQAEGVETDFIAIGKKCRDYLLNHKYSVISSYLAFGDQLNFERILPIVHQITDEYLADKYEQVVVVYTHFESSLSQISKVSQLLPFEIKICDQDSENIIFDPTKTELVSQIVPRMLETKLWQYILESAASEHSARMVAMKNANENAEDLIFDLTLSFNQTRQAGITREIAEISAGKMTLEG